MQAKVKFGRSGTMLQPLLRCKRPEQQVSDLNHPSNDGTDFSFVFIVTVLLILLETGYLAPHQSPSPLPSALSNTRPPLLVNQLPSEIAPPIIDHVTRRGIDLSGGSEERPSYNQRIPASSTSAVLQVQGETTVDPSSIERRAFYQPNPTRQDLRPGLARGPQVNVQPPTEVDNLIEVSRLSGRRGSGCSSPIDPSLEYHQDGKEDTAKMADPPLRGKEIRIGMFHSKLPRSRHLCLNIWPSAGYYRLYSVYFALESLTENHYLRRLTSATGRTLFSYVAYIPTVELPCQTDIFRVSQNLSRIWERHITIVIRYRACLTSSPGSKLHRFHLSPRAHQAFWSQDVPH